MLETLQPPVAIYCSAWLPLILERNTLLNYWLRFPLPLLSIFCPTHNGTKKLCPSPLYNKDLSGVTSVLFPRKNKIWLSRPFLVFCCSGFFPPRVWWFSTLPFGSPGSLILSDLQYWEPDTPAKGLLPLTRLFTSCSQHPAYTLQFHVKSMMFLTGIQQKICCMPVLCSFPAMSSSKEGLDEIIFCVDISLLWGCWTGSMQRYISIQTCKRQSPPPKSNH